MTSPPPAPRTPDDVLALVVGALGGWPSESLVLVGLGPRRLPGTVVRARLDLLLQGDPDDLELSLRVDAAVGPCAADGARGVLLLLLSDRPGCGDRVIGAAASALGRAGLALADAAVLRGARWTSARGSWTSAAAGRALLVGTDDPAAPEPVTDDGPGACAAAIAVLRAAGTAQAALDEHVLPAWFDALDRVVARAAAPDAVAPDVPAADDAALDAVDTAAPDAAAREALDAPLAAWLLLGLEDPARRDAVLASVLPGGRAALGAAHPHARPSGTRPADTRPSDPAARASAASDPAASDPAASDPAAPDPAAPDPAAPGTPPLAARDRWGRAVTGVLDARSAGASAELDAAAALLRRLAELAPAGARAEPLAVLAWWAWWRCRPEQAEVLAAQALAASPGHGLAGLVLSCAGHRLVPAWARAVPARTPWIPPAR